MEPSTRTKTAIAAGASRWHFPGKECNYSPKRMADRFHPGMGTNGGSISPGSINTRKRRRREIQEAGRLAGTGSGIRIYPNAFRESVSVPTPRQAAVETQPRSSGLQSNGELLS